VAGIPQGMPQATDTACKRHTSLVLLGATGQESGACGGGCHTTSVLRGHWRTLSTDLPTYSTSSKTFFALQGKNSALAEVGTVVVESAEDLEGTRHHHSDIFALF